ncbi:alkyl hydroperoxide reductase [Tautonia marina]|uniref:alkyl hydroperoxide reductase n=1 Tax=Tautonia marina TaxID=2653855 RepID=UPI001260B8B6|nr:alkyl hydroperoxide reductase [Tautonia marina]
MRNLVAIMGLLGIGSVGASGLVTAAEPEAGQLGGIPSLAVILADLDGALHDLGQNDEERVRAFVFLSTECPISNGSIRTLNALGETLKDSAVGVDLFGVVFDPYVTRAEIARHFREFEAAFPILVDASGLLFEALRPTHVPEAFVLDSDGRLVYRGAIDNAWEALGRRRIQAEQAYLAEAIEAASRGWAVSIAETEPVGCLIELPPEDEASSRVTYTRDIAPILQARCLNCHREGQAAPFALATYEQAARRARQIVQVTQDRIMPPWIPGSGHERFVGDRRLTDRELDLLVDWAEGGRARGDEADLPPVPSFAEGWLLGQPDLIVRMPEPFTVPADGPDLFQNFVIPLDLDEDRLVAAIEFHPGNPRVAHHAVLFLDESGIARALDRASSGPGYPNFGGPGFFPSGALGGWSVGNTPRTLPNGMGRYLKRGSDLVVQMHYHPTGKEETDQSEIGLFFVPKPASEALKEPAKLVGSIWLADYEIDLPAGANHVERSASYTLPRDVILVGVVPHMHLLGKAMTVTAILPDGQETTLIDIEHWNYNWQDEYYYERPFTLPAGTRLEVRAAFDNSAENPSNPSRPPRRVTWGDGTNDEMLFCFFLIAAERTEDVIHVILDNLGHDARQPRLAPEPRP